MFEPGSAIEVAGESYRFACMPGTKDIVFGAAGRAGTVFKAHDAQGRSWALKVFNPNLREPGLVALSRSLAPLAKQPGLEACQRRVLTPQGERELLQLQPDLLYALLMPWLEGQTWSEIMTDRVSLTAAESLAVARDLASKLCSFEQQSLAHCDLSGGNLVVRLNQASPEVAFVDLEGLYTPSLARPKYVPAGSPGYGPGRLHGEQWGPEADRLSGAILIAEILTWCRPEIREASAAESFFEEDEVQRDCPRYQLLRTQLKTQWGEAVARMFDQAWQAKSPQECPTLGEWDLCLPDTSIEAAESSVPANTEPPKAVWVIGKKKAAVEESPEEVAGLWYRRAKERLGHAKAFASLGQVEKAVGILQRGLTDMPVDHPLTQEIEKLLADLQTSSTNGPPSLHLPSSPPVSPPQIWREHRGSRPALHSFQLMAAFAAAAAYVLEATHFTVMCIGLQIAVLSVGQLMIGRLRQFALEKFSVIVTLAACGQVAALFVRNCADANLGTLFLVVWTYFVAIVALRDDTPHLPLEFGWLKLAVLGGVASALWSHFIIGLTPSNLPDVCLVVLRLLGPLAVHSSVVFLHPKLSARKRPILAFTRILLLTAVGYLVALFVSNFLGWFLGLLYWISLCYWFIQIHRDVSAS